MNFLKLLICLTLSAESQISHQIASIFLNCKGVGLISFSDDGSIIISTLLDSSDRVLLHLTGEEKILVDSKNKKEYLKFHRENILK